MRVVGGTGVVVYRLALCNRQFYQWMDHVIVLIQTGKEDFANLI